MERLRVEAEEGKMWIIGPDGERFKRLWDGINYDDIPDFLPFARLKRELAIFNDGYRKIRDHWPKELVEYIEEKTEKKSV